jgi:hypothetical protein
MKVYSRLELVEIMCIPYHSVMTEKVEKKIQLKLLRMDEQEFIDYTQTIIPMKINPIIKNRYYLS